MMENDRHADVKANGSNAVHVLDYLTWEEVRAMRRAELVRFRALLEHWRQLSEVESERRNTSR